MTDKCKITRVGTKDEDGAYSGWEMDGSGSSAAGVEVKEDGTTLLGGYTAAELDAILEKGHREIE